MDKPIGNPFAPSLRPVVEELRWLSVCVASEISRAEAIIACEGQPPDDFIRLLMGLREGRKEREASLAARSQDLEVVLSAAAERMRREQEGGR